MKVFLSSRSRVQTTARVFLCFIALSWANTSSVQAQSTPLSATAPSAATTRPAPILIPTPLGFVRSDIAHQTIIASPADMGWVATALKSLPPTASGAGTTTKPTVVAANFGDGVRNHRDTIIDLLTRQLAMPDAKLAVDFVDHPLTRLTDQLRTVHVQTVYLVVTQSTLKQLVTNGWGGNQFHYNRVADKIIFDGEVSASLDGPSGDSLVPIIYSADQSPADRGHALSEAIDRTETGVTAMITRQGKMVIQSAIGEFILEKALSPLHLDHDQDWFDAGVVGWLSSRATALITDDSPTDLITSLSTPSKYNPVSADSIDLAHPLSRDELRPDLAAAYADTYRRRSVGAVAEWLASGGDDLLPKTIAGIREKKPVDNASLLAVIKEQTGVDMAPKLAPGG